MTADELAQLDRLLAKWIKEPGWDYQGEAWQTLVEAHRQVKIEQQEHAAT